MLWQLHDDDASSGLALICQKAKKEGRAPKPKKTLRARELWEQNGRPVGRDVEFWLQAERELNENE